jgi:hypothetical protein
MEFIITLMQLLLYVFIGTAVALVVYLLTLSIILKRRIQSERLNEGK